MFNFFKKRRGDHAYRYFMKEIDIDGTIQSFFETGDPRHAVPAISLLTIKLAFKEAKSLKASKFGTIFKNTSIDAIALELYIFYIMSSILHLIKINDEKESDESKIRIELTKCIGFIIDPYSKYYNKIHLLEYIEGSAVYLRKKELGAHEIFWKRLNICIDAVEFNSAHAMFWERLLNRDINTISAADFNTFPYNKTDPQRNTLLSIYAKVQYTNMFPAYIDILSGFTEFYYSYAIPKVVF